MTGKLVDIGLVVERMGWMHDDKGQPLSDLDQALLIAAIGQQLERIATTLDDISSELHYHLKKQEEAK